MFVYGYGKESLAFEDCEWGLGEGIFQPGKDHRYSTLLRLEKDSFLHRRKYQTIRSDFGEIK